VVAVVAVAAAGMKPETRVVAAMENMRKGVVLAAVARAVEVWGGALAEAAAKETLAAQMGVMMMAVVLMAAMRVAVLGVVRMMAVAAAMRVAAVAAGVIMAAAALAGMSLRELIPIAILSQFGMGPGMAVVTKTNCIIHRM
jgi:hypothetical protein